MTYRTRTAKGVEHLLNGKDSKPCEICYPSPQYDTPAPSNPASITLYAGAEGDTDPLYTLTYYNEASQSISDVFIEQEGPYDSAWPVPISMFTTARTDIRLSVFDPALATGEGDVYILIAEPA